MPWRRLLSGPCGPTRRFSRLHLHPPDPLRPGGRPEVRRQASAKPGGADRYSLFPPSLCFELSYYSQAISSPKRSWAISRARAKARAYVQWVTLSYLTANHNGYPSRGATSPLPLLRHHTVPPGILLAALERMFSGNTRGTEFDPSQTWWRGGFCGSSRNYGRNHHQRRHETFDGHAFNSNRREECGRMPGKTIRSAPRTTAWAAWKASSRPHLGSRLPGSRKNHYNSHQSGGHLGNPGLTSRVFAAAREEIDEHHRQSFEYAADEAFVDGGRCAGRGCVCDRCAQPRGSGQRRMAGGGRGVHLFPGVPVLRAIRRKPGARRRQHAANARFSP